MSTAENTTHAVVRIQTTKDKHKIDVANVDKQATRIVLGIAQKHHQEILNPNGTMEINKTRGEPIMIEENQTYICECEDYPELWFKKSNRLKKKIVMTI